MVTLVRMAMTQVQVLWWEEILEKPLYEAQTILVSARYCSPDNLHLFSLCTGLILGKFTNCCCFDISVQQLSEKANRKWQIALFTLLQPNDR